IPLVSPNTVNRNAGVAATPPAAFESLTYQRPKNVWPTRDEFAGTSSLMEPKPWPAPLPDSCTLMRAKDAVAGIVGPAPGSLLSITSTADAPPNALLSPTVKLGLPASAGSMAVACGMFPPEPCVPLPVIV